MSKLAGFGVYGTGRAGCVVGCGRDAVSVCKSWGVYLYFCLGSYLALFSVA